MENIRITSTPYDDVFRTLLNEQGIEQGIEQGEDKLSKLIAKLMENKRSQDIMRVTQDKEYRNKLYEEYLIGK